MKREVEFTGKKVQDAVNEGLASLGITLDDAEIKIISNGGLFKKAKVVICYDDGLEEGAEPAKKEETSEKVEKAGEEVAESVRKQSAASQNDEPRWGSAPVKREPTTTSDFGKQQNKPANKDNAKHEKPRKQNTEKAAAAGTEKHDGQKNEHENRKKAQRESVLPTDEQVAAAKEFTEGLLKKMNIEGTVSIAVDDGMRVNLETEDSRVIGHRGEVLDSMQQLIGSVINTSHGKYVHITVDGLGYRDRRKETLESIARKMADKAVRIHRKVSLDAMNSADRRIIHAALGDREDVFTRSEGHEPDRRVVIIPKRH